MAIESSPHSFNVKPHNKYQGFLLDFQYDIDLLKHIITDFPKLHASFREEYRKEQTKELTSLSKEDKQQFDEFYKYITELVDAEQGLSGKITMRKGTAKFLEKSFFSIKILNRTISFLMEMCLVYLITTFEEFLKNQFKEVAKNNIDILKSGKMLTYEEIIESKDIEEVYSKIMNKVFKEMISFDIETLVKKIQELFTLDLSREPKWYEFTERFYRRHVIIHSNSIPDEKYCEKTRTSITDRLTTDETYLKESLILFNQFAMTITVFLEKKFPTSNITI